jgi:hypothetical protein
MATPPFRFRYQLLPVALLLPQMAHADALGAVGLGRAIGGLLALFGALFLILLPVAYLRDAPRLLAVLMGLSFIWGQFPSEEWFLFGRYNPFAYFCLPLGAWLLGVIRFRRAPRELVQLLWLGLAISGLRELLRVGAEWGMGQLITPDQYRLWAVRAGYYLLELPLGLGSWWVVLRQLRLEGSGQWWQPWWRAPAIVAAVGAVCQAAFMAFQLQEIAGSGVYLNWAGIGWNALQSGAIGFVVGVLALRLIPPPAAPPAASGAARRGY